MKKLFILQIKLKLKYINENIFKIYIERIMGLV